jgi:hypothetical protein
LSKIVAQKMLKIVFKSGWSRHELHNLVGSGWNYWLDRKLDNAY